MLCALLLFLACGTLFPGPGVEPHRWWAERGPVVPHDTFPGDCTRCHTSAGWQALVEDFSFDHLAETGVPLEGAHQRAECLRCHNDRGPVSLFAQRGCAGCHEDVHRRQLGTLCESCHDQQSWRPRAAVADHARTRFPLVGVHALVACFACHEGAQVGQFSRVDIECVSCHRSDLADATNPDHMAQGLVDDCQECHVPTSWKGAGFRHKSFPLSGSHLAADCTACHTTGQFNSLPRDCAACHQAEYDATTAPNHAMNGFPPLCQSCHDTTLWTGAVFTHATWPLTGAHAAVNCNTCHSEGIYKGLSTNCVSCHQADYDDADDPDHIGLGLSTLCQQCHDTGSWEGAVLPGR